ncbi:pilus assembly protein TadC [Amylibacter ulvae]|uniref:Pilus assembly protein TadC n=1 Tax=Paramylibacter ulvae TaxID=1651968 RepID=A0ABQ3D0G1_9RHOB|nr:type II secretion system F family protein [Amylibacter ulvae]GHA50734.1 pilus assembly protein TadC [Amylibacter ulvae]
MELIQEIFAFIVDALGPNGPLIVIGMLGVFLVMIALPMALKRQVDPFDKLEGSTAFIATNKHDPKNKASLRQKQSGPNLDRFAAYLEPQDQKQYSARRLKLIQAGYRTSSAVRTFHAAQLLLSLGSLVAASLYVFLFTEGSTPIKMSLMILGPALAGYYLPHYWVERRRQTRQTELLEAFPDALDLMLICVESGQTLDHTILRVSREIEDGYPTLAEELTIISNEMRAGKDRSTVLRDFASRSDVADIKAFVTVLIQSATFGTTIGEALRLFSSEMRDKRVMRAEEKANTLPTKMTLCTMLFILPPLLAILIGPSIYDIYRFLVLGQSQ